LPTFEPFLPGAFTENQADPRSLQPKKELEPKESLNLGINKDQRSPSISTDAFNGHPDRRLGAAFFAAMLPR
jgi:hypothetical protein